MAISVYFKHSGSQEFIGKTAVHSISIEFSGLRGTSTGRGLTVLGGEPLWRDRLSFDSSPLVEKWCPFGWLCVRLERGW